MTFTKGNAVQVNYPGTYFDGRTGYVEDVSDSHGVMVLVDLGTGEMWFHPDELTLLSYTCAVCGKSISQDEPAVRHSRLGVWVHFGCPKTNVCGEDITTHTLQFVNLDKIKDGTDFYAGS